VSLSAIPALRAIVGILHGIAICFQIAGYFKASDKFAQMTILNDYRKADEADAFSIFLRSDESSSQTENLVSLDFEHLSHSPTLKNVSAAKSIPLNQFPSGRL